MRSNYGLAVYGVADLVRRATTCVPDLQQVVSADAGPAMLARL